MVLWLCVLYFVLPLWWLLVSSTKDNAALFSTFGLWFGGEFSLWENLQTLFTVRDGIFPRWLVNTFVYSISAAVGATLLSTMAGYAFAKYEFPGKKALFSATLGAIMIPLTALALPTYLLFSAAGLTNTPWAVIIPSLVSPFGVYLMRVYAADAIPDGLIEAARVDGAGEFRIFWQVGLRLLGPGLVTVFLFSLVATWNNYFLPLIMLNSSDLYPDHRRSRAAPGGCQPGRRLAGPVLHGHHRLARLDRPAGARVPVPAALLAVGARDRKREGMNEACRLGSEELRGGVS